MDVLKRCCAIRSFAGSVTEERNKRAKNFTPPLSFAFVAYVGNEFSMIATTNAQELSSSSHCPLFNGTVLDCDVARLRKGTLGEGTQTFFERHF